MVPESDPFFF